MVSCVERIDMNKKVITPVFLIVTLLILTACVPSPEKNTSYVEQVGRSEAKQESIVVITEKEEISVIIETPTRAGVQENEDNTSTEYSYVEMNTEPEKATDVKTETIVEESKPDDAEISTEPSYDGEWGSSMGEDD